MKDENYTEAQKIAGGLSENLDELITYASITDTRVKTDARVLLDLIIQAKLLLSSIGGKISDALVFFLDELSKTANVVLLCGTDTAKLLSSAEQGDKKSQTTVYNILLSALYKNAEDFIRPFRNMDPVLLKDTLDTFAQKIDGICALFSPTVCYDAAELSLSSIFTELWEGIYR